MDSSIRTEPRLCVLLLHFSLNTRLMKIAVRWPFFRLVLWSTFEDLQMMVRITANIWEGPSAKIPDVHSLEINSVNDIQ